VRRKITREVHENNIQIQKKIPAVDRFVPPIPKRSCRKSLGVAVAEVLGTGASSELKSSKSTKGAAAGFATPFGSLRSPGVTPEAGLYAGVVACVALALFTR
jgi:hypothetical protein